LSLLIVIRAAGESTVDKCKELIENSDGGHQVEVITEVPFSKAVKKTFELGLDYNRDWTLAVDADVLVKENGISELVALANSLPEYFFRIEGKLLDRFCGFPRNVGMHLYRTPLFTNAMQFLSQTEMTIRPESRVVKEMVKAGYHSYQGNEVYGIHDYHQHYRDVFRKTFVYAQKHKYLIAYFKRYWTEMQHTDDEFKVALLGLEAGLNTPTDSLPHLQELYRLYEIAERDLVLVQQPMPENVTAESVAAIIRSHHIPDYGLAYARAAQVINRSDQKPSTNLFRRILKRVMLAVKS